MKIFLMLLFLVPGLAFAQDTGLYDPLPPEGAAFIRFINMDDAAYVSCHGKKYIEAAHGAVTPYYVCAEGTFDVAVGNLKIEQTLKAGKFYTAIEEDSELKIFEDPVNDNRTKAQILFYNVASTEALSLKTEDGRTDVVTSVGKGGSKGQVLNAVKVKLAIFNGDEKIADVGEVSLSRGQSYSVIFTGGPKPLWVQGTTDTTK